MNDQEQLNKFLDAQHYMTVAVTLDDGTPWATPVRIQRWEGKEFEWDSKLDTEHSKALTARPAMAVTIFQKAGDEFGQFGFYAKGRGELVNEFKPGFGRYRFIVERSWVNDQTFVKREVELG